MNVFKLAPSILAADFGRLREEAQKAEKAGADLLHIDIMDGHFVPNITFGPDIVKMIRNAVSIPLDVHLMIQNPQDFINPFIDAGSDYITIHPETGVNIARVLEEIKKQKVKAGPAINPDTPVEKVLPVLPFSDIILVMSVFPGFGGQSFMPSVLEKIRYLKSFRTQHNHDYEIEIDGGINEETLKLALAAGVDIAVAGTAIFRALDINIKIREMKNAKF